jgi:hypothetical protein
MRGTRERFRALGRGTRLAIPPRMRLRALLFASFVATSGCTALVRFAAGPPKARARQAHVAVDPAGQAQAIAIDVDLYNPNPLDLRAARFDYTIDAGAARTSGHLPVTVKLVPHRWTSVPLLVPIDAVPELRAAIAAGQPFVVTGSIALDGGATGLAVGVSGEGVMGAPGQIVRVAAIGRVGGVL